LRKFARCGARVVVDNTFATPYLQQPLALGAHVTVHSSTKYLGGHSDVVGGFAAVDDAELADELRFLQNDGCRPFAIRLLPRAARREDARGSHGTALRERPCNRADAARARRGRGRSLSGARRPPRPRRGRPANARLRRHGLVPVRAR
jgi:hypothetical protein